MEYVFGYGSLSTDTSGSAPGEARVATLADCARVWDVAMDNRVTVPGYKYYVDPVSGVRPDVAVTFLDLVSAPGQECVGMLLPVGAKEVAAAERLDALDRRERNYDRCDVTSAVRCVPGLAPGSRVWAYQGSPAARLRYDAAAAAGTAVVQRTYLDGVEAGFAWLGLAASYAASTRGPECPVVDLTRVDVPS